MTSKRDKHDNKGRRKGSRTKGYFFRTGRGWYAKAKGKFHPLTNEAGERLKDQNTPAEVVKLAHARFLVVAKEAPRRAAKAAPAGVATVRDVCIFYLGNTKELDKVKESTIGIRVRPLFDLCNGIAAEWQGKPKSEWPAPKRTAYGDKPAEELTRADLLEWCQAHKGWGDGGRRTYLQAVKRVMNFAVEWQKIKVNQIRGMKIPASVARATYISAEQEQALCRHSCPALKTALQVLIRTGMRPGCEFSKITPAHVIDDGQRMEIRFAKGESKTNKPRVVRIGDVETAALIRKLVANSSKGERIFRNTYGKPWNEKTLSEGFRRAKRKALASGATFDDDVCLYSCRHTYAKRTLTTLPINMSMLAALMGNTVDICQKHYADLTKENAGVNDLLWAALQPVAVLSHG